MRRQALVALLAALLAGTAVGCGGARDDDGPPAIASREVIREFHEAGLPRLEVAPVPDPSWDQLSFGLDISEATQRRYGTFAIYVVDPGDEEAVASLLADKDTAEPIRPDANGIYWDYDELAKSYVAEKRYGENVVLAWWNEKRHKGVDVAWVRLDKLLEQMVASESR
jgi:hypothetical protein